MQNTQIPSNSLEMASSKKQDKTKAFGEICFFNVYTIFCEFLSPGTECIEIWRAARASKPAGTAGPLACRCSVFGLRSSTVGRRESEGLGV